MIITSINRYCVAAGKWNQMNQSEKLAIPICLLQNLLPVLDGVYVHAQAPTVRPQAPGPYRALIDTGSSHSWVKPHIGNALQPHSLEGYVLDHGHGTEEDANIDVKFGFMKGLSGKPVRGWVQLEPRLPAIEILLFSGDFDDVTADVLVGMDLMCSFLQFAILIRGTQTLPMLALEF
ncbi:MAG: hypothetical protein WBQ72_07470 [Terriglobales bacterium]